MVGNNDIQSKLELYVYSVYIYIYFETHLKQETRNIGEITLASGGPDALCGCQNWILIK
jgi:hypothetical protein